MTPPERCPRHLAIPSPHACNECREAYEAARDWHADLDRRLRLVRLAAITQLRLEAAACGMCDEQGRAPDGLPCSHNPEQQPTNRRGVAACREALSCHA